MASSAPRGLLSIRVGTICFFLALVGMAGWQYAVNGPRAVRQEQRLASEWGRIRTMEGSWGGRLQRMSKPEMAGVGSTYSSRTPCPEIFSHYDAELARNGWVHEQAARDAAGTRNEYRKGQYRADVTCADGAVFDRYRVNLDWWGPTSDARGLLIFLTLAALFLLVAKGGQYLLRGQRPVRQGPTDT